mgnify:CR=1 FL=1
MELKEGMYVRTDNGMKFGKVTEIHNVSGKVWYKIDTGVGIDKSQLTKNKIKHRIIDLIEVGDYVNGYKVVDIKIFSDSNKYMVIATEEHQSFWKDKVFEDEIKSIVTKEQFESMSYKVGGNE